MTKIKILFLSASPQDDTMPGQDTPFVQAYKDIKDNLNVFGKNVQLEPEHRISIDELQQLMLTETPQIVHFFGHGEKGFLLLEDDRGKIQQAKLKPFANMFKLLNERTGISEKNKISCVVLVACNSKKIAEAVSKYVDCTIGMTTDIGVDSGREFAKSFYSYLFSGNDLQFSFEYARNKIGFTDSEDQKAPKLFLREGCDTSQIYFIPGKKTKPGPVPTQQKADVEKIINDYLALDSNTALIRIGEELDSIKVNHSGQALKTRLSILEALGHIFIAQRFIAEQRDFSKAVSELQKVPSDLKDIGAKELVDISNGMALYCSACVDLQQYNFAQASDDLKKAQEYLQNASQFSQDYQLLISGMEPDISFTASLKALMKYDFDAAKMYAEQASIASSKMADRYYTEDDLEFYAFKGQSKFYKAYVKFFVTWNDFNAFDFDKILADQNSTAIAHEANELLKRASKLNVSIENMVNISKALANLLEAVEESSKILKDVFHGLSRPRTDELSGIRQKVIEAENLLAEGGSQSESFYRFVIQMDNKIKNMEKLIQH